MILILDRLLTLCVCVLQVIWIIDYIYYIVFEASMTLVIYMLSRILSNAEVGICNIMAIVFSFCFCGHQTFVYLSIAPGKRLQNVSNIL